MHDLVVFLGLVAAAIVPAQENKPADATGKPAAVPDDLGPSTPTKPDADAKLPDAIQALMPSIVTVTRIGQPDGDPANQPVTQTGVVVDSSG